jgi:hypothetical protein
MVGGVWRFRPDEDLHREVRNRMSRVQLHGVRVDRGHEEERRGLARRPATANTPEDARALGRITPSTVQRLAPKARAASVGCSGRVRHPSCGTRYERKHHDGEPYDPARPFWGWP